MRHRKDLLRLGRPRAAGRALFRSLTKSLILHGSVKTTEAKARWLRRCIEPLITKAKVDSLERRRYVLAQLGGADPKLMKKLFTELGPKYRERRGGYTRTIKIGHRVGDRAPIAHIEFV